MASEVRAALLRRDPVSAAREVLYHLDIYLCGQLQSYTVPTVDRAIVELLEEFMFQEPHDRGLHPAKQKLSCVQELQLLDLMCSYFQEQSKDAVRQLVFSTLFSPRGSRADGTRLSLLSKLVSMAIALGRSPVLDCAAVWMQRTPVGYCVDLAKSLVEDYCNLIPGSITTLRQMVQSSPRFYCQFITAVTALYDFSSDSHTPPESLLETVVSWVCDDPRLTLYNFLNSPIPATSPPGYLELTPIAGLMRWCIKAPLACHHRRSKQAAGEDSSCARVQEKEVLVIKEEDEQGAPAKDLNMMYSRLHLGVLQVLQLLYSHLAEKKLLGRLPLVAFEQVTQLAADLRRAAEKANPLGAPPHTELALDRFAQAVQVAMAMGALLCTRDDLRKVCSSLPPNSLLQLVLAGPVQSTPGPPQGHYSHMHPTAAYPTQSYSPGVNFPYRQGP
ncbi:integrator complex subunit 15 isoform X1 [Petromyzon marinus]|uniref:Uncharacterized protein C7orf26 homolog isoform X1 n=1 Tax=Petromyzon marinus TaxID=7757 RepID=A0AAJ7X0W4_PETMA|nr:uncharacterized protein C7orf26 homolog isoform X1 [Petromyzon marinus]